MQWFNKHRLTITIISMVLFLLFCIGATSGGRDNTTMPEGAIRVVTSPVERVLYSTSQYIRNLYDFIVSLPSLKARNEQLEKELKENQVKLADYDMKVVENNELHEILDFTTDNNDYEYIPSSVISIDPYKGFSVFVIDKGSSDGVKKNMTVVLSEGLVGRVLEVSTGTSKVLSIIDTSSMFNGVSVKSKDYIRVTGDENNRLKGYADFEALINPGDIVVTSGMTGIFRKNIVVGIVKEVLTQEGKLEKLIIIEPSVDLSKVNKVLIIK
ncbi:rod shape-determining protein MreC [Alkalibaculum sp. M08DMB]|uniref:Cell shape-determining protein MreC n=1 Tax=Alkalibaculum sporogenes TaxID=2655001 RepID=A0A6A7K6V2_9FIRM|nr:rod shape-determining protein MreC [Alkalibaculum sporogenes]MPW24843.1 rod shape-determining protein MreC [Alkalibaculum sporogenes]